MIGCRKSNDWQSKVESGTNPSEHLLHQVTHDTGLVCRWLKDSKSNYSASKMALDVWRRTWLSMFDTLIRLFQITCISFLAEGGISHVWMSYVTNVNESCHTYEWTMSRVWMNQQSSLNSPVECLRHDFLHVECNDGKGVLHHFLHVGRNDAEWLLDHLLQWWRMLSPWFLARWVVSILSEENKFSECLAPN